MSIDDWNKLYRLKEGIKEKIKKNPMSLNSLDDL